MKMPRRPFYLPMPPQPDIFGLQPLSILAEAFETEEQRLHRIAKVETGVAAAFKAARAHLGEEQARNLFLRAIRRPKRGRGKLLAQDRDFQLLKAYDEAIQNGETVAALARRLRANGTQLGNTPGAIAAQIRKLVLERKARQRAAAIEARRWRMATRNDPPSLLAAAKSKK